MLNTVNVPEQFRPLFEKAQAYVSRYFSLKDEDPSKGTIEIFGERYILVRAASMSVEFFDTMKNLYSREGEDEAINIARSILFDIAHTLGKMDARNFHKKMNLKDPIEKLSAGPIHFAHSGWAFVDISPESTPSPDENFCLVYDHPFSFESDAWIRAHRTTDFPICVMNAGYSSGWCEESFGVSLVASEITCKARGDEACRFVMAHPSKIEHCIQDYLNQAPELAQRAGGHQMPGLFERKWMQEKLRESEANYLTIFNEVNDAIFVHDLKTGRIVDVNESVCTMYGYTRAEVLVLSIGDISSGEPPFTQQDALERIKTAREQGPQVFEWQARHKSGRVFWIEVSLKLAEIMGKERVLAVVRDITERRQVEERLKCEKERADLLARKAVAASEAKSRFLANTSHEIRTPMNAILGFSDMLADENLSPAQREHVDTIRHSGHHLLQLIDDILDFSKIEAGQLDIEIVDCSLATVLNAIESTMTARAQAKALDFTVVTSDDLPAQIRTDPFRLQQCLNNLINNAIKFTDQGHVYVKVSLHEESHGHRIRIEIEDTGIGIPQDRQRAIFESFTQADGSTTRAYGGTGLGLTITKQLARLLHGELRLTSEAGRGSVFSLDIPTGVDITGQALLNRHRSPDRVTNEWCKASARRFAGRVLVAEDVEGSQMLMKLMLSKLGVDVLIAENGHQAMEKALSQSFDLILMDMQMPHMNGYEATRALKQQGYEVPIVALTANAMKGDDQVCIDAGCDGYLTKPIDRRELCRVLAKYLPDLHTVVRPKRDAASALTANSKPPSAEQGLSKRPSHAATDISTSNPIDWDQLVERLGDEDIVREIMPSYMKDTKVHFEKLSRAVDAGDCPSIAAHAHALKGVGRNLSVDGLSDIAYKMERAGKDNDIETATLLFDALSVQTDKVLSALSQSDWINRAKV
jgi:PAS domain S-box-containing protein